MRRLIYVGILYLLFNALFCVPAFAADWEVYSPDIRESGRIIWILWPLHRWRRVRM